MCQVNFFMVKLFKKKISLWLKVVYNSSLIVIKFRYDVALGINTLGVKHVLSFAKKCIQLKVLVHVSTGWYRHVLVKITTL